MKALLLCLIAASASAGLMAEDRDIVFLGSASLAVDWKQDCPAPFARFDVQDGKAFAELSCGKGQVGARVDLPVRSGSDWVRYDGQRRAILHGQEVLAERAADGFRLVDGWIFSYHPVLVSLDVAPGSSETRFIGTFLLVSLKRQAALQPR